MTKEQEITLLYQLIEKHFGSGVLMQFADLIEDDNGVIGMVSNNNHENSRVLDVATADASRTKNKKAYDVWYDMIFRCYSPIALVSHPTYADCAVCDEWLTLSNFISWHDDNYVDGYSIDKDIIKVGNKIYSPEYCCYVPKIVNSITTRTNMSIDKSLTGASFNSARGMWQSGCRNPITKKNEYLGLFKSERLAHKAWAKRKSEISISVCESIPDLNPKVLSAIKNRSFLEV